MPGEAGYPRLSYIFECNQPSNNPRIQILPPRIPRANQPNLLRPRPMLNPFLTRDRRQNLVMPLKINQHLQTIPLGKTVNPAFPMIINPPHQISRHPHVQNAIPAIGHNINPSALLNGQPRLQHRHNQKFIRNDQTCQLPSCPAQPGIHVFLPGCQLPSSLRGLSNGAARRRNLCPLRPAKPAAAAAGIHDLLPEDCGEPPTKNRQLDKSTNYNPNKKQKDYFFSTSVLHRNTSFPAKIQIS